jgi:hypothetical protein
MTGEQSSGEDDAMLLRYCVGAAARHGPPHQSIQVPQMQVQTVCQQNTLHSSNEGDMALSPTMEHHGNG